MSSPTLLESHRRFAAALDELRRKYQNTFVSWLNAVLARDPNTAWHEVPERIALIRGQFAEEFINVAAPPIIEELSPGARPDIVKQLRSFETRDDRSSSFDALLHAEHPWRAGTLRIMVGAALGAAAALLLLALQTNALTSDVSANPTPAIAQPAAAPAAPPSAGAVATPAAPPAAASPATPPRPDAIERSALRIIIGALGAALGAFVVVCPPLRVLVARFGFGKGLLRPLGKVGVLFLVARRMIFATGIVVLLLVAAGFIGLVFIGPKPVWSALFALAAVFAIILARYALPSRADNDYEAMHLAAVRALDHQLGIDAALWSAIAAGLMVRSSGTARIDPKLDQVRSVIVGRRNHGDPAESILRIVEQELRLTPGGAAGGAESSEFTWQMESADRYEAVGVVQVGDTVTVMAPPRMSTDASGTAEVFQKGKVMRKRTGR